MGILLGESTVKGEIEKWLKSNGYRETSTIEYHTIYAKEYPVAFKDCKLIVGFSFEYNKIKTYSEDDEGNINVCSEDYMSLDWFEDVDTFIEKADEIITEQMLNLESY